MAKTQLKEWYKSRTIQIAILQSVLAIVTIFATEYPEVGAFLATKSFIDIFVRIITVDTIK